MKKSELKQLIKQTYQQVIKQQIYKQKEGYQSTNKDFKDILQAQIKGALQAFFTKYYYTKDAISIITSVNSDINKFVSDILQKINKKK